MSAGSAEVCWGCLGLQGLAYVRDCLAISKSAGVCLGLLRSARAA